MQFKDDLAIDATEYALCLGMHDLGAFKKHATQHLKPREH